MVDITTLYISFIFNRDNSFRPIVISNIPFNSVPSYGGRDKVFIINEDNIKNDARVPSIRSRVSIDDFMEFISVVLKVFVLFVCGVGIVVFMGEFFLKIIPSMKFDM